MSEVSMSEVSMSEVSMSLVTPERENWMTGQDCRLHLIPLLAKGSE